MSRRYLPMLFLMLVPFWGTPSVPAEALQRGLAAEQSTSAIAVNPAVTHQRIDGFGASSAAFVDDGDAAPNWSEAQADRFFSQSSGLGLSLLRVHIRPNGTTAELSVAQQAVARGATVWAAPWTPPAAWKSNQDINNGGYLCHGVNNPVSGCRADHYGDYATQLATFVVNMTAAGVPIYAIAMQNEPSTAQDYETCIFTDAQLHTFIPYLYNALAVAGVGSTKIIMPEASDWDIDGSALPTLGDGTTAAMVGIVSAHGYGNTNPSAFSSQYVQGKPVWETEDATTDVYDPSISNGLTWATTVHNYLTNGNVSAWHYWEAVWPPSWQLPYGTLPDNSALTDANGNLAKRAYVLGQWAKFVRPGYQRIDVTNGTSLLVTAFADPVSHNWAIVAINSSGSASAQTFNVGGSQASSVTPWVTSSTLSLAQQPPVPVSGGNFSYTLPAQSIVSLVGSESTAPPTNTPTATPVPGTATNTPRSMATWTPTVTPTNTARGTPTATAPSTPTPRRHRRRP